MFDRSILVRDIAEPVVSFDDNFDAEEAKAFMLNRDYDFLAARSHGEIAGYAIRDRLGSGQLGDWIERLEPERLVSDRALLLEVISRMRSVNPRFVSAHDRV
jgi:hypothetical protein